MQKVKARAADVKRHWTWRKRGRGGIPALSQKERNDIHKVCAAAYAAMRLRRELAALPLPTADVMSVQTAGRLLAAAAGHLRAVVDRHAELEWPVELDCSARGVIDAIRQEGA